MSDVMEWKTVIGKKYQKGYDGAFHTEPSAGKTGPFLGGIRATRPNVNSVKRNTQDAKGISSGKRQTGHCPLLLGDFFSSHTDWTNTEPSGEADSSQKLFRSAVEVRPHEPLLSTKVGCLHRDVRKSAFQASAVPNTSCALNVDATTKRRLWSDMKQSLTSVTATADATPICPPHIASTNRMRLTSKDQEAHQKLTNEAAKQQKQNNENVSVDFPALLNEHPNSIFCNQNVSNISCAKFVQRADSTYRNDSSPPGLDIANGPSELNPKPSITVSQQDASVLRNAANLMWSKGPTALDEYPSTGINASNHERVLPHRSISNDDDLRTNYLASNLFNGTPAPSCEPLCKGTPCKEITSVDILPPKQFGTHCVDDLSPLELAESILDEEVLFSQPPLVIMPQPYLPVSYIWESDKICAEVAGLEPQQELVRAFRLVVGSAEDSRTPETPFDATSRNTPSSNNILPGCRHKVYSSLHDKHCQNSPQCGQQVLLLHDVHGQYDSILDFVHFSGQSPISQSTPQTVSAACNVSISESHAEHHRIPPNHVTCTPIVTGEDPLLPPTYENSKDILTGGVLNNVPESVDIVGRLPQSLSQINFHSINTRPQSPTMTVPYHPVPNESSLQLPLIVGSDEAECVALADHAKLRIFSSDVTSAPRRNTMLTPEKWGFIADVHDCIPSSRTGSHTRVIQSTSVSSHTSRDSPNRELTTISTAVPTTDLNSMDALDDSFEIPLRKISTERDDGQVPSDINQRLSPTKSKQSDHHMLGSPSVATDPKPFPDNRHSITGSHSQPQTVISLAVQQNEEVDRSDADSPDSPHDTGNVEIKTIIVNRTNRTKRPETLSGRVRMPQYTEIQNNNSAGLVDAKNTFNAGRTPNSTYESWNDQPHTYVHNTNYSDYSYLDSTSIDPCPVPVLHTSFLPSVQANDYYNVLPPGLYGPTRGYRARVSQPLEHMTSGTHDIAASAARATTAYRQDSNSLDNVCSGVEQYHKTAVTKHSDQGTLSVPYGTYSSQGYRQALGIPHKAPVPSLVAPRRADTSPETQMQQTFTSEALWNNDLAALTANSNNVHTCARGGQQRTTAECRRIDAASIGSRSRVDGAVYSQNFGTYQTLRSMPHGGHYEMMPDDVTASGFQPYVNMTAPRGALSTHPHHCTPQFSLARLPDGQMVYRQVSAHYDHCPTLMRSGWPDESGSSHIEGPFLNTGNEHQESAKSSPHIPPSITSAPGLSRMPVNEQTDQGNGAYPGYYNNHRQMNTTDGSHRPARYIYTETSDLYRNIVPAQRPNHMPSGDLPELYTVRPDCSGSMEFGNFTNYEMGPRNFAYFCTACGKPNTGPSTRRGQVNDNVSPALPRGGWKTRRPPSTNSPPAYYRHINSAANASRVPRQQYSYRDNNMRSVYRTEAGFYGMTVPLERSYHSACAVPNVEVSECQTNAQPVDLTSTSIDGNLPYVGQRMLTTIS